MFLGVMPCSLADITPTFFFFFFFFRVEKFILKVEEADSSEILTLLYQITRHHIPEDSNINYPLLREGLGIKWVRQTVKLRQQKVLVMKSVFLYCRAFIVIAGKYVASCDKDASRNT
jgi:hypothetical protein